MRINAIFCCCALFGVQINSMFYAYFGTVAVRLREKHLGTFSVHVRLMILELASLEKKKERR